MRTHLPSFAKLFGIAALAIAVIAALACSTADEEVEPSAPAPAAPAAPAATAAAPAPAPAAAPAAPAAPAPAATVVVAAQPKATEAKVAHEFTEGTRGGNMRIATGVWFDRWDMTTRSHWSSTQGLNRFYSGVLQFSPRDGLTVTPDLAHSWEFDDNFSNVTLQFNEGVKWHDGEPFTVDDVVYTINRWIDPPEGIPQPRVAGLLLVDRMEKVDDLTMTITMTNPTSRILAALADSWHIMLPEHVLTPAGGNLSDPEQVIGTGPFMMESYDVGNNVVTKRQPGLLRRCPGRQSRTRFWTRSQVSLSRTTSSPERHLSRSRSTTTSPTPQPVRIRSSLTFLAKYWSLGGIAPDSRA